MRRRRLLLLLLFLIIAICLSLFACKKKKSEPAHHDTLKTEKKIPNIEITIPASLAGDDAVNLNDEAKVAGVKEIIKNDDGSITMKMTEEAHKKLLSELKKGIDESIQEILTDKETYPSFSSITYNSDVTEFTICVDPGTYDTLQSLVTMVFYLNGNIYQIFNAVPEDKIKTIVNFVDKDTGEIIESMDSSQSGNATMTEQETNDTEAADQGTDFTEETGLSESSIDMTGDYIGNIPCPQPPENSSYTIYNNDNPYECIAVYIENIDNANFQFHLTKATQDSVTGVKSEELIFNKHIAHYTDSGYYEYIGKNYHLYFRYNITAQAEYSPAGKIIEIYGLENLYSPTQYGEKTEYQNMTGTIFRMNVPFAG